jgi:plasmid stabilization system protein ParE
MNYSFHPDAEKELEEIENYYDSIRAELGDRFRAETEMAISRILDFPHTWQRLSQNTRRRALKTFLYGIVYRVKPRDSNTSDDAPSSRTGLLGG